MLRPVMNDSESLIRFENAIMRITLRTIGLLAILIPVMYAAYESQQQSIRHHKAEDALRQSELERRGIQFPAPPLKPMDELSEEADGLERDIAKLALLETEWDAIWLTREKGTTEEAEFARREWFASLETEFGITLRTKLFRHDELLPPDYTKTWNSNHLAALLKTQRTRLGSGIKNSDTTPAIQSGVQAQLRHIRQTVDEATQLIQAAIR